MALLDSVKNGMTPPIKTSAYDDSITMLIQACLRDLYNGGLKKFYENPDDIDDAMLVQACILYCKANGYDDDGARYAQSYELFKNSLAMTGKYGGGASG